MLFGATMMQATVTPGAMRETARAQTERYLDDLVDTILAGITQTVSSTSE